jgi:hypothetical protein
VQGHASTLARIKIVCAYTSSTLAIYEVRSNLTTLIRMHGLEIWRLGRPTGSKYAGGRIMLGTQIHHINLQLARTVEYGGGGGWLCDGMIGYFF